MKKILSVLVVLAVVCTSVFAAKFTVEVGAEGNFPLPQTYGEMGWTLISPYAEVAFTPFHLGKANFGVAVEAVCPVWSLHENKMPDFEVLHRINTIHLGAKLVSSIDFGKISVSAAGGVISATFFGEKDSDSELVSNLKVSGEIGVKANISEHFGVKATLNVRSKAGLRSDIGLAFIYEPDVAVKAGIVVAF